MFLATAIWIAKNSIFTMSIESFLAPVFKLYGKFYAA